MKFTHPGQGLTARHSDKLQGFMIAGPDRKFVWADAIIDGDSVLVTSAEVPKPESVRYAWSNIAPWAARRPSSGALRLTSPIASYQGVIQSVSSQWDGAPANAFVTPTPLPAGEALRGTWMIVALGTSGTTEEAFEIDDIAIRDGKSGVFLKDDPGLRMKDGSTKETFFPLALISPVKTDSPSTFEPQRSESGFLTQPRPALIPAPLHASHRWCGPTCESTRPGEPRAALSRRPRGPPRQSESI